MSKISRRGFVKKAVLTGAAITACPTIFIRRTHAAWEPGSLVHPGVDNLRVVGITDKKMTKEIEPVTDWARQEELVNNEIVWENIDKLACTLAETRNPKEAWRHIFIKPPRKTWSDTVVAIKTNNIGRQHTRSAVMSKICHTLIDSFGVKAANIHIYDGVHGEDMSSQTPFAGLPKGCRIEDEWGGISKKTPVGAPWKKDGGKSRCLKNLVDGSVDILINIAMCKGHSGRFGGFTMTMKNHLGTFSPMPVHLFGGMKYLSAINQTQEILGPFDKRTGKVLYPRQQLCFVDALWASERGPGGYPSDQPNFLAMGVHSPIVDYVLATKFRGESMGWEPNWEATSRLLKDFGYKKSDLPVEGKIIEAI